MPDQAKRINPISALKKAWRYLREVTGDAAYDNYAKYCAEKKLSSRAIPTMNRAEFYSDSIKRKYSTINRCC